MKLLISAAMYGFGYCLFSVVLAQVSSWRRVGAWLLCVAVCQVVELTEKILELRRSIR
jgi:hypothetical protein